MRSVRSLAHTVEELGVIMKTKQHCHKLCTMCFIKMCLQEHSLDSLTLEPAFTLGDRDIKPSSETKKVEGYQCVQQMG